MSLPPYPGSGDADDSSKPDDAPQSGDTPGGSAPASGSSEDLPPTHQPYGQPPPYGQVPYGQQPPAQPSYGQPPPYGQAPYGHQPYAAWPQGNDPAKGTDGFSIAALVTGLTCCFGIPPVVLGIVGILRTKGGERKGRWMAVTGLVLGLIGCLVWIGAILAVATTDFSASDPLTLDAGECFNSDDVTDDEDEIGPVNEVECSKEHDAEVIAAWTVDSDETGDTAEESGTAAICLGRLSPDQQATIESSGFDIGAIASDPKDIGEGDRLVCYVYGADPSTGSVFDWS